MAEPMKATDSKSKEKRSLLDEEIGKDFHSSWRSMSVKEDDAMDFSFATISKGKKKAFNFDKLDIDFNLDGGFDKLSSFKVDMPDLDFSSPSKKDAKAKGKSEEETDIGKQQEKKDRFTFSFDFNELDGFDFDSSLNRGEKTSEKNQETKAVASESSEVSKIDQALEDDCITAKLPVSKNAANSKAEISKGRAGVCNSIDPCTLKMVPTQGPAPEKLIAEQGSRISPEKLVDTNAKETYKSSPLLDREVSSELCDQHSLQSSPMNFCSGNNSNEETVSNMQAEVCSQGRRINSSSAAEQDASDKVKSNEGSIHENFYWNNSLLLSESDRGERKGADGNIQAEIGDGLSVQGDIVLKDIYTASLSAEILDNIKVKKDIQNPTPKLPSVSSESEPTVGELTARKNKEAGAIRSRFFRNPEENRSQLYQPSETGKGASSFGRKKIGDMHLCPAYKKMEDFDGSEPQNGRKLVRYSKLSLQELTKGRHDLLQSENNVGSSSDIRAGFPAGTIQIGGNKLIGKSSVQDKAARKGESLLLSSDDKNASLQANPPNHAEKATESTIQTSVNPKFQVPKIDSIQNSKFHSEANKIAKKATALSSFKSTRSIGPNKDHLISQKETNSLRNLEQNKDTPGNTSKTVLPVGIAEEQTPKLPSLKRKIFQESNGDSILLKPLKRLSQSPSEIRNLAESFEGVADKEVQNHKSHMEVSTKNILCDHLTSAGSEVPREVNMTELEFPSVVEKDGNVEKAEAYGKELDDICNMLKKKHEEAKEILVRAIVNNNNLLMLNHPIFKEKVEMVQKFAELLISKELPT